MKIKTEYKNFWEKDYFVVKYENLLHCLLCGVKFCVTSKKFNIERHFNKFHHDNYGNISHDVKKSSRDFFNEKSAENEAKECETPIEQPIPNNEYNILKASYVVSLKIAKSQNCLSIGPFIKEASVDVLECLGYANQEVQNSVSSLKLSRNT